MTQDQLQSSWSHERNIIFAVNPSKQKKYALIVLAFILSFLLLNDGAKVLGSYLDLTQKQEINDEAHPYMQTLASEGKRSAIIWIAVNYPGENTDQLKQLSSEGDGEAMALLSRDMYRLGQKDESDRLIKASAENGYYDAMRFIKEGRRIK